MGCCRCIFKSVAYEAVTVLALMLWVGCGVLGRWQMGEKENFFFLSQFYCAKELSSYGAHAVCRVSNEERRSMYNTNQSLGTL